MDKCKMTIQVEDKFLTARSISDGVSSTPSPGIFGIVGGGCVTASECLFTGKLGTVGQGGEFHCIHTQFASDPRIAAALPVPIDRRQAGLLTVLEADNFRLITFKMCVFCPGFRLIADNTSRAPPCNVEVNVGPGDVPRVLLEGCTFHLTAHRNARVAPPIDIRDGCVVLVISSYHPPGM